LSLKDATWADFDQRGRLVYTTKDGFLYSTAVDAVGHESPVQLADFNGAKPKRTKSPAWARVW